MQTVWAVTLGRTLSRAWVHTAAGCGMSTHIQVCSQLRLALSCPGDCSPYRGQCSWQEGEEGSVGSSQ